MHRAIVMLYLTHVLPDSPANSRRRMHSSPEFLERLISRATSLDHFIRERFPPPVVMITRFITTRIVS